jgi:hypothetical protein
MEDEHDPRDDGLEALLDALGDRDSRWGPNLMEVGGPDCFALLPRPCATIEEWEARWGAADLAPASEEPAEPPEPETPAGPREPRGYRGPRVIRV